MEYIVIENFHDPIVVVDPETGEARIFTDLPSAEAEAAECQEGIVVPLTDIIGFLRRVAYDVDEVLNLNTK